MTKYQESSISNAAYGGCGCLLLLMGIGVISAIACHHFCVRVGRQSNPKTNSMLAQ
jgi:hypothetical protein